MHNENRPTQHRREYVFPIDNTNAEFGSYRIVHNCRCVVLNGLGKVTDKIGQAVLSDATASVVSDTGPSTDSLSGSVVSSVKHTGSLEGASARPNWLGLESQRRKLCRILALESNIGLTSLMILLTGTWHFWMKAIRQIRSCPKFSHSRSAIIVDLDSGEILYEKAADTRRSAASVTKVLAARPLRTRA